MPAFRDELPQFFEEIPDDATRIRCRMCSDRSLKGDVIFERKRKKKHLSTRAHQEAERQAAAAAVPEVPGLPTHTEAQHVHLRKSIMDLITESDEEHRPDPAQAFFSDYVMYNEGAYTMDREPIIFSAGEHLNASRDKLREQIKDQIGRLGLFEHNFLGKTSDVTAFDDQIEEPTTIELEATLRAIGIESSDDELEDTLRQAHGPTSKDNAWWPHGSKTMFLLDLLDSLPRLRLSDDHMRAIIWVMKECGTPDVPTFSGLRKFQTTMKNEVFEKPQHHTSSLDNHFFMNHPTKLFALDWANPLVRPYLHLYPEISPLLPVREFWQAEKWTHEVQVDELTPMWADWTKRSHRHYYVNEIAQLSNSQLVVPMKWVTNKGVESFLGYEIHYSRELHSFNLADPELKLFEANMLAWNYLDLKASCDFSMTVADEAPRWITPLSNPLRTKANGRPMFRLRVMPWSDDVSGNVSKQYNPHTNIYIQNLSIPHKMLAQEYFVRFCSTSSFASSSEQFVALSNDFKADIWHDAYDCELEQMILFQLIPHLLPADNPQQSEDASHIGGNGQHNCRRDNGGGPDGEKETDDGYNALFCPGDPRITMETIETIKSQIRLACMGVRDSVQTSITQTGVKDKIASHWIEILLEKAQTSQKLRISNASTRDVRLNDRKLVGDARKAVKESIIMDIQHELWNWIVTQPAISYAELQLNDPLRRDLRPGDHYNILLSVRGVDPHKDTTYEMLHTWLLGPIKYLWHDSSKSWDKKSEGTFAARLESSIVDGLTISPPRARYLVQYKNSLIGKHFKCLQQLAVFHLHGLVSDRVFDLWKASGELGAHMWFPEVKAVDSYISDLQVLIDNVLDIWALIDPARIITKLKLHLLSHLPEDIRRFGPPILYSTEVFECWNAIFRLCSILSNHLSPSNDIATTLGDMERFKHQASGGWWYHSSSDQYVRAGPSIRNFLTSSTELQRRLGWADASKASAGRVKIESKGKRDQTQWQHLPSEIQAAMAQLLAFHGQTLSTTRWDHAKYAISKTHDTCHPGSWVFYSKLGEISAGQIMKILVPDSSVPLGENLDVCVIIEQFTIPGMKDSRLNMPQLVRPSTVVAIKPVDLLFICNVQHNCVPSGCKIVRDGGRLRQERIETDICKDVVAHTNKDQFIINMHALHNAHLIREVLPRALVSPIPYLPDSKEARNRLAAQLRVTGPAKRAETQRKAQETRARNKAKQQQRQTTGADADGSEEEV